MDGLPYLVFEHVDGPTLDVALARAGRLDPAEERRLLRVAKATGFPEDLLLRAKENIYFFFF
jgi:hypothetical protein